MAEIEKLNKTFQREQILQSDEMNTITQKIDEVVGCTNALNDLIQPQDKVEVKEIWNDNAYRNSIGGIANSSAYQITKAKKVKRGDLILLNSKATQNIYVLSEVSSDNTFIKGLVLGLANAEEFSIRFAAPKDMYIEASGLKMLFNLTIIPNSLADYSVPPAGGYNRGLYEAAGAVYNEETGFYELNGLTDITEEQMADIFAFGVNNGQDLTDYYGINFKGRTNLRYLEDGSNNFYNLLMSRAFRSCPNIEVIKLGSENKSLPKRFTVKEFSTPIYYCKFLKKVIGIINVDQINVTINLNGNNALEYILIYGLKSSILISSSPLFNKDSILYMIQNSAATSPITITLHADAYAMAMADEDIQAALAEKTNVSLASA